MGEATQGTGEERISELEATRQIGELLLRRDVSEEEAAEMMAHRTKHTGPGLSAEEREALGKIERKFKSVLDVQEEK
jgi:hypothetical protein